MKNLVKIFALILFTVGLFTACEPASVSEEQELYEDFQGVDKSIQRPGSQGNSGDSDGD